MHQRIDELEFAFDVAPEKRQQQEFVVMFGQIHSTTNTCLKIGK